MKKIITGIFVFIFLLAIALYFYVKGTAPDYDGKLDLEGLKSEVIIKRNKWGIPLIEAGNTEDLLFAMGFVHAQDRLFQMDLSRRYALGRLSEIFGKSTIAADERNKRLMIEESIDPVIKDLERNPRVKAIFQSYCNGVNAFIRHGNLPIEFKILRYRPEPWTLKDSLAVLKNMELVLHSSGGEIYNMKIIQMFGKERGVGLIYGHYGSSIINEEEYRKILQSKMVAELLEQERLRLDGKIGSNNWVISGKRTETGKPILANDPHLSNMLPSYFYQLRGRTEGLELSGFTLPGTPFVIMGRNDRIGWGITNIGTDVIDYFILKINPDNHGQYLLDGKWVNFGVVEKKIKIKGGREKTIRVLTSVFGPVVEKDGVYMARHSLFLYPTKVFEAIYIMNTARNIEEFVNGLSCFSSIGLNIVFADRRGNTGYYPTGYIPVRGKGDGSLPVEIDRSEDAWKGFYPEGEKPFILNPDKGYIATANNPVLPEGKLPIFNRHSLISFRADRIKEFIEGHQKMSVELCAELQTDSYSKAAEFLIKAIKDFKFRNPMANFVLEKFKNWDYRIERGITPFLFYRFQERLSREIFQDEIRNKADVWYISPWWTYRIMGYPEFKITSEFMDWIDDKKTPGKEDFRDIVKRALIETYKIYARESKNNDLRWEKIHLVYYKHPLGRIKLLSYLFNLGPYYMPGGKTTVLKADFRSSKSFHVVHFATFRMILDFSDFSRSLSVNSTGQSGNFMSPYYSDQEKIYTGPGYIKMEDFSTIEHRLIIY